MKISRRDWQKYITLLRKVSNTAADKVAKYINNIDIDSEEGIRALLDYSYAVATKYGEGATALACQMYDEIASLSGASVPIAEPAATATYGEVAMSVRGKMMDTLNPDAIGAKVGLLVRRAGMDTTLHNAIRDGAEWAWIPSGDTCPYCLVLASNGWQKASDKVLKGNHADHIHTNCDCSFVIRFDNRMDVEGYNPEALLDEYMGASEGNSTAKINALRRKHYAANKGRINAQKRAAYARRTNAKIPNNEELFETVVPTATKTNGFAGQNLRLSRAHLYPDNEGVFNNNPRPRDDGKQTDIIKPRNIMKEMNRSETGAEALIFINKNNIPVTLLYNVDVKPTLMGEYDPVGNRIFIYASNTKSVKETALTVIHEATHAKLGGANTRKNEVRCRLEELRHKKRDKTLTLQDIKNTIRLVNRHKMYSKYPWR